MIGVLVPAHNEAATIGSCLRSLQRAARHPGLNGREVRIVVALDACSDSTAVICRELQVETIDLQARCVGAARAAAAARLLQQGARWLASTDADGTVPPQWLAAQLDGRSDGSVAWWTWPPAAAAAGICAGCSGAASAGAMAMGGCTAPTWVSRRRLTVLSAASPRWVVAKTWTWYIGWRRREPACAGPGPRS